MNIRQYIIPFLFTLATTYLIKTVILDRIFLQDVQEIKSGQAFLVTSAGELQRPLETQIAFSSVPTVISGQALSTLETRRVSIESTRLGAALDQLVIKKVPGSIETSFEPIAHEGRSTPGYAPLLVAFSDHTPWLYDVVRESPESIVYEGESDTVSVEKEFKVLDNYLIEMVLTIEPRVGTVRPRILIPAPRIEKDGAQPVTALVNKSEHGLQQLSADNVAGLAYAHPKVFGLTDRYLVHTLVADQEGFAQRGYFVDHKSRMWAVIEGPEITEKTTWHMRFYCGPKEAQALHAADARLTELLNYGWLAPLCHGLLMLLKFFYGFVFNYGLAIMLVTGVINLLLIPLTSRGEKSMQSASDLAKKIQYLEQKYKYDPEKLAFEKSELMRKHSGIDALGCAAMIVQLGLFFALNRVLSYSIELYKAPFFGWIVDLSARDPYYVLAGIAALAIIIPGLDNKDPRQRMISFGLGLLIGGVVAQLSAGLSLFMVTNIALRPLANRIKAWLPA